MSANGSAVVLGGTGFVGRHVCVALRKRGFDVIAVARRPPKHEPTERFLALDVGRLSAKDLAAELEAIGPTVIVNAIGSIWGRTNEQMWEAAATPTLRLLEALALLDSPPRLVHLGSVLEYGRVQVGTTVEVELDPLLAHRDYVDVRDVADAVVAAATSTVSGELVDIGGRPAPTGRQQPVRYPAQQADVRTAWASEIGDPQHHAPVGRACRCARWWNCSSSAADCPRSSRSAPGQGSGTPQRTGSEWTSNQPSACSAGVHAGHWPTRWTRSGTSSSNDNTYRRETGSHST
jgi:hypothetical protein